MHGLAFDIAHMLAGSLCAYELLAALSGSALGAG